MRAGIAAMLKNADQDVLEASDGEAALSVALKEKPDVIVTDIRMPHMTGLEMLEELRKDEWGKTVPVVILTGDESSETLNKALESGVTSYFAKSSDPSTLQQQILAQIRPKS
jgi:two-component system, NarL family, nitrate/nitrite response regulator NarL